MNSSPASRQSCKMQMGCKTLCYCNHQEDLIHDPTLKTWIRTTPPPPLSFYSAQRFQAIDQLALKESQVELLNIKLHEAQLGVEAALKVVDDVLLQIKHAKLEVTKCHVSLAPIRCLPNEILGHVITFLDPPELPDGLGDIAGLYCVSKAWNAAVRHSPGLWTNWHIDTGRHLTLFPSEMEHESSSMPHRLESFIQKAMNRPLSFHFASTGRTWNNMDDEVPMSLPLINVVTRSAPRWNRFLYECLFSRWREACFCSEFFDALKMGTALENLEWDPCERWTPPEDQISGAIDLQMLNTLTLKRNTIIFPFLRIPALTDLSLCEISVTSEDLSSMACSLSNLSVLRCIRVGFENSAGETGNPIQFHNLRDLHMIYGQYPRGSSARLAFTLVNQTPALTRVYRTVYSWGEWPSVSALSCDIGTNITFLEFNLDLRSEWSPMRQFHWSKHQWEWGMSGEMMDWLVLPKLVTVSLIWTSCATVQDSWGNNNRMAAMLLDIISAVRAKQVQRFCPRLEYLKCYGVTCDEPFIGKSGAEVFLLALENFSWNRSRILNGPTSSIEPKLCLVTVTWDTTTNSAGLPNLVDARWEDVTALLDGIPTENDTGILSDEAETEESESCWERSDSEESRSAGEEEMDSDLDGDYQDEGH